MVVWTSVGVVMGVAPVTVLMTVVVSTMCG
jgi:hypothetical protein